MKRYIKTNTSGVKYPEVNSIMDLFVKIEDILLVDDASKFDIALEDESYGDYSDAELCKLPDYIIECGCSRDALRRIYNIEPDKVSYFLAATLGDFLAKKYSLRSDELNYILSKLKECQKVDVDGLFRDSRRFVRHYGITKDDILDIVHSLKTSEFNCLTQSYNSENFGHDLLVFFVDREITLRNGNKLPKIVIYMKIDYTATTSDGRTGVIMSIHPADVEKVEKQRNERYPIGHIRNK